MIKRKVAVSILASGLALASGACGSSGGTGADTGSATGGVPGSGSTGSGGRSSGGSSANPGGGVIPIEDDDGLSAAGGGTIGGEVLNGGHRPLTADELAALTSDECSQFDAPVEPQAPVLELVVDVSGSMTFDIYGCTPTQPTCNAPQGSGGASGAGGGFGAGGSPFPPPGGNCCDRPASVPTPTTSKWDLFLPAILAALDGIADGTAVGMQLFPTGGGGFPGGGANCAAASGRVSIAALGAAGSAQRTALADRLNNAQFVNSTPTHDGLDSGQKELTAYTGPGKKFLILITDGEPTQTLGCVGTGAAPTNPDEIPTYTDPIIAAVQGWAAEGIGTFVVGSPGSEVSQSDQDMRPFLSKVASVGGTGEAGCMIETAPYCHFDTTASPDFAAALSVSLEKITELVSDPCTLTVPPPPNGEQLDKAKTSVILTSTNGTSTLIQRDDSPADCTLGWTWTGDSTIALCGASCDQVKADVGAQVNASFGCSTIFN
jgi:hypothetical protein